MHNSPTMIAKAGWRMDMESSAWSTCQNAQLTLYDCQSSMKHGHGIISMITVTNMPECTTHPLWLPEQDGEWTWNCQHDQQSPTCQNAQLTHYDFQSRIKNGHGIISMITVINMPECTTHQLWLPEQDEEWTWNDQCDESLTCQSAQLTDYDCQSRMKNGHGIISMITITTMPECTTHLLWWHIHSYGTEIFYMKHTLTLIWGNHCASL